MTSLATLISSTKPLMIVSVTLVLLVVAYIVWIFELPDSEGANSTLMIVLMSTLIAVPIVVLLFLASGMVKHPFYPTSQQGHRDNTIIDMENGSDGSIHSMAMGNIITPQSFSKAWDHWLQENTTTATIDDRASAHTDEPCAICLSEYQVGEVSRRLPCGHTFHNYCFRNCFTCRPRGYRQHHICPLCRAVLGPTLDEEGKG